MKDKGRTIVIFAILLLLLGLLYILYFHTGYFDILKK